MNFDTLHLCLVLRGHIILIRFQNNVVQIGMQVQQSLSGRKVKAVERKCVGSVNNLGLLDRRGTNDANIVLKTGNFTAIISSQFLWN